MIRLLALSFTLALVVSAYAKQVTIYDKHEKPMHIVVPDEPKPDPEEMIPCNPIYPWVVMSRKERTHLIRLIYGHYNMKQDPNLLP